MKKILLALLLLGTVHSVLALPFTITAASPLPTAIIPGQTLTAFYTVKNNTSIARSNNFIKQFPTNTSQVFGPGLCGPTFDLAASGNPGFDSCILELNVLGATDGCENPLLACFPGGLTCSGTVDPLDVTSVSPTAIRGVVGGTTLLSEENIVEDSLYQLEFWRSPTAGIPADTQTNDIDCMGSGNSALCVLGGVDNVNTTAFISESTNGAQSWAAVTGLSKLANNTVNGVSCTNNKFCVAAGANIGIVSSTPYLATTTAATGTWTDAGFTALPMGDTTLADAACAANGSICIAVGTKPSTNAAFIFQSTTPATPASWAVATLLPTFLQPLVAASCLEDGGLCIAVASGAFSGGEKILQTKDKGTTWVSAHNGTVILVDSSCTGSGTTGWCIAVGKNPTDPRILQTTNSGNTWTVLSPLNGTQYNLTGASCTGTISSGVCVAVGYDSSTNVPVILISQNVGAWTVINNASITGLSASSTLSKVSCSGNNVASISCVAVGTDITNNTSLLIKSFDSGNTWAVDLSAAVTNGSYDAVAVTGG